MASAKIAAFKNTKPTTSFKLNKMQVDFLEMEELKHFKNRLRNGELSLEQLPINKDFKFIYSIDEPIKLAGQMNSLKNMKVEITDQTNRAALIKEIDDSMSGLIELYEAN